MVWTRRFKIDSLGCIAGANPMSAIANFTLSFEGGLAEDSRLDFYDLAQAIEGFQRSLALTTHLALNGEIITQAPSLKGANIIVHPAEIGSWKMTATILTGLYFATTAPADTPLGHFVGSLYDYAVSQTLGFHVDYEETLWKQYLDNQDKDNSIAYFEVTKVDSLIEKIENPIKSIHRPIAYSETAESAGIYYNVGKSSKKVQRDLDIETFNYVKSTRMDERTSIIQGRVSSYNINTYQGRIFDFELRRPIAFELSDGARNISNISRITRSLNANALSKARGEGDIKCSVIALRSKTGIVKKYIIIDIN